MLKVTAASTFQLRSEDAPQALTQALAQTGAEPLRRVNRFIQLAVIGARRCVAAGGGHVAPGAALYLATGQGNVADTVASLKSLVGEGQAPMPFTFINVSSNMAGYFSARSLGITGPNLTVSQRDFPVEAVLELAMLAVDGPTGPPALLVGAVDEMVWPLSVHRRRLGLAPDVALGEGSQWLLIEQGATNPRAAIHWARIMDSRAETLAFIRQQALGLDVCAARGHGLDEAEFQGWLRALGIERRFDYLDATPWYDTRSAYGLCQFIETRPSARLLHIDRNEKGRYGALLAEIF